MCSGSKAGSYLRLVDCVYHSTLGPMVVLGGGLFLMSEVPLNPRLLGRVEEHPSTGPPEQLSGDKFHVQGYLAHKKTPTPLGPP